MNASRNNHYVPEWYQKGFYEPGKNQYHYLDLRPDERILPDGRRIEQNSKFVSPSSRAFVYKDLYSTYFGTAINDEIEVKLFGDIDTRGSKAVRAFSSTDQSAWVSHFQSFFEYIDAQKLRTPKGLDWLKAQYPELSQNELMFEMQAMRMMHCTIWAGGVREIVSAEEADVKFLITDHPVTTYNYAIPPKTKGFSYPREPGIELKATQTLFPLNRDLCLILTNLEYAQNPNCSPLEKRTFSRRYGNGMAKADELIRCRKLSNADVVQINYILKSRASRYIAAGRAEWLYPEKSIERGWKGFATLLRPPEDKLWGFGGEMLAHYESGHVHYQDAFGRTEKVREFLQRPALKEQIRNGDYCGCGSGRTYALCCKGKPENLRASWSEMSIFERNMCLFNGIADILQLEDLQDWVQVRKQITDEKIKRIYGLHEALWPRETDLIALLPKPDGRARAVYSGVLHPDIFFEFALGASVYFGEILIQHPFLNPNTLRAEFSPISHPEKYRQEILKSVLLFLTAMPLVEAGLVNFVPDPCDFDHHLRDQMFALSQQRSSLFKPEGIQDSGLKELTEGEYRRSVMLMSDEQHRARVKELQPDIKDNVLDGVVQELQNRKERDPLAVLQQGDALHGEGLLSMFKLAPNYEMLMYLAQLTGASIVTDSAHRWREINLAIMVRGRKRVSLLENIASNIEQSVFSFPQQPADILTLSQSAELRSFPSIFRDMHRYLSKVGKKGQKPNFEKHLSSRFQKMHHASEAKLGKLEFLNEKAHILCAFPDGGIYDSTINRLLLMSSSELHLHKAPQAFYIKKVE